MNAEESVFLLLGSNVGNREANLRSAITKIASSIGDVVHQSHTYESEPWGKRDQPEFYNKAVQLRTDFTAPMLLTAIKRIEKSMGRTQAPLWDKRLIDIDILLFGSNVMTTADLTIPHPQLPNRKFALIPLAEIAETILHPVLGRSIGQLLTECRDQLRVTRILVNS